MRHLFCAKAAKKLELEVNRIVIDIERCKGCCLCVEACPRELIEVSDHPNASGAYPACFKADGKCTACALCATMCPDAAIEVYREVKGKKAGKGAA